MTETIDNPSGIVVFDTETTGLDGKTDEILQFSACDGEGKVLINTYLRPVRHTEWPEAGAVNGITPEMVADAPTLEEMSGRIKAVLESAKTLIGYNTPFDLGFVSSFFRPAKDVKVVDVMLDFAEAYGQKDYRHGGYKWHKLVVAANYYHYEFKAHDSMNDVLATLFVHNQIELARAADRKRRSVYEAARAAFRAAVEKTKLGLTKACVVVPEPNPQSKSQKFYALIGDKWYEFVTFHTLTEEGLKKAVSLWVSQGCQQYAEHDYSWNCYRRREVGANPNACVDLDASDIEDHSDGTSKFMEAVCMSGLNDSGVFNDIEHYGKEFYEFEL